MLILGGISNIHLSLPSIFKEKSWELLGCSIPVMSCMVFRMVFGKGSGKGGAIYPNAFEIFVGGSGALKNGIYFRDSG